MYERRQIASHIVSQINKLLRDGFNAFTHQIIVSEAGEVQFEKKQVQLTCPEDQNDMLLIEALRNILKVQCAGREQTTVTSYRSFVNTFCDWLAEVGKKQTMLRAVNATFFQQYLFYKLDKKHSNRNINDTIRFFSNSFEKAKKIYNLPTNPIDGIDKLPKRESSRFKALTADELSTIKDRLLKAHPHYYCYTLFTAHEFIRPKHIAYLQRRDIDFDRNEIFISAESSKNKKVKTKQLMKPVKDMLLILGIDKLPPSYYIFGNKDFTPDESLYSSLSKRSAELWRKEVIEGLGIDKKMYALKHTAASYYINNNNASTFNIRWLQQHLEHHSIAQTEQYLQGILKTVINEGEVNSVAY